MEAITSIKTAVNGAIYRNIVKRVCFLYDAERVHTFFIRMGKQLGTYRATRALTSFAFRYEHQMLEQTIAGIHFKNPVGLSAGFDKNAELTSILGEVGFGFAEVGSITADACDGNAGKRLERFPRRNTLWVNLGLNNQGAKKIARRLQHTHVGDRRKPQPLGWGRSPSIQSTSASAKPHSAEGGFARRANLQGGVAHRVFDFPIPIGISIAKTNCRATTNSEIGLRDYLASIDTLHGIADYITLNISCPNAYGGQQFSEPALFEKLARAVAQRNLKKPIFVKLSPDLGKPTLDALIEIARRYRITGFICTNLTKKHGLGKGGLSGKVVEKEANALLEYVYRKSRGDFVLIGVGGIFSAADAYKKIKLGANLVQLITGMIYQGPQLIGEINAGLVQLLRSDGYANIGEAVGADVR